MVCDHISRSGIFEDKKSENIDLGRHRNGSGYIFTGDTFILYDPEKDEDVSPWKTLRVQQARIWTLKMWESQKTSMLIWNQFQPHFLKLKLFQAHTKLQNQADIMANVSGL